MLKRENVQEQETGNNALLNVITPVGLGFSKNSLDLGENMGKIYGLIRYPQKVEVEWLSRITNIPSTIVSIGWRPVDNATLINAISRSVVQQRGLAEGAKDPLSRQRAEKAADDGEKIIMQIDREGETVGLMSVSVMPIAKDEKTFKKVCRRAESMKCSEGTKYASMIDDMVELEVESTHKYYKVLEQLGASVPKIDERLEHMMATGMIGAFFEMVLHKMPFEDAKVFLQQLNDFYTAGWMKIMGQ